MGKTKTVIFLLSTIIVALVIASAVAGIFSTLNNIETVNFLTVRGENVEIQNIGIYRYNPKALVAEGIAWDMMTLFIGIPLLIGSLILYIKNSTRGAIVFIGILAYLFYQYLLWAVGWAYNRLFLAYVAIYSLSFVTILLVAHTIGIKNFKKYFSDKMPVKTFSIFIISVGILLTLLWLSEIVPSIQTNELPEAFKGLNTLFVQALDLGVIVPFALFSGVLLYKKRDLGNLLVSIGVTKYLTMSLAILAMMIGAGIMTEKLNIAGLVISSIFVLIGMVFIILLLKNIKIERFGL